MNDTINDYISELEHYLSDIPAQERQDVVEFYREFLLDGDFLRRSTIENELGTPKQLARKILADYSISDIPQDSQYKTNSNLKRIWHILMGLFAVPIGIPLLFVLFIICAICFAFLMVFIAIAIAFIVVFGTILIKSIALLFTSNWAIGCFHLGRIIIGVGFVFILSPLIAKFINMLITKLTIFMRYLGKKLFTKRYYTTKSSD